MNKNYKAALGKLSNGYEGKMPENYEGTLPDNYVGFKDRSLDFGGNDENVSFANENELAQNHQFTFTIMNNASAALARTLALCPAYFTQDMVHLMTDNKGNQIDAIINEGLVIGDTSSNDDLSINSENKPVDELLQFTKFNPTRFIGIKLQCQNASQFGQAINVKQVSPFRNLNDYTILPDSYKNSQQYDQSRVEIPLDNFQFDNNTIVSWRILPGSVVTVTLFGGAILNTAKELNRKASIARANLTRSYGPGYLTA